MGIFLGLPLTLPTGAIENSLSPRKGQLKTQLSQLKYGKLDKKTKKENPVRNFKEEILKLEDEQWCEQY